MALAGTDIVESLLSRAADKLATLEEDLRGSQEPADLEDLAAVEALFGRLTALQARTPSPPLNDDDLMQFMLDVFDLRSRFVKRLRTESGSLKKA